MASLQDLINLAKADGGKFFVLDENGEPKLIIMGIEEYQKLLVGKLQKQVSDIENINKEIIKAQLQEPEVTLPVSEPLKPSAPPKIAQRQPRTIVDLREEVIDPTFDFEGPKLEIDDL